MKLKESHKRILLSLYHYFCFFLLMAFLISCCMMLFLSTMAYSMGIEYTEENINTAAILTFWNVVFLSLLCTIIDGLRRRFMVERHVKKIVNAAEKIASGDFSARIPPLGAFGGSEGLDRIAECFNMMAEELACKESMQADFIGNVSHELKTPLTVMQNYGTLLACEGISESDRIKYATAICTACKRLAALIGNILKLNKLENSSICHEGQIYDLGAQLAECILGYEEPIDRGGIEVSADLPDGIYVKYAPELLIIVWNNLISNAVKFTERGGNVGVILIPSEEYVEVKISDTGCGISPEVGKHIFEKFYQGDTSHTTEGNGLGLALVKRVIDILGAEISVESTEGVGSVFTVKLRRFRNVGLETNI